MVYILLFESSITCMACGGISVFSSDTAVHISRHWPLVVLTVCWSCPISCEWTVCSSTCRYTHSYSSTIIQCQAELPTS